MEPDDRTKRNHLYNEKFAGVPQAAQARRLAQTTRLSVGDALKRTVLPAFTLIDSPVRGLRPLRAFVLRTIKVPKLGNVNRPFFFNSFTMAETRSVAARLAAVPVSPAES